MYYPPYTLEVFLIDIIVNNCVSDQHKRFPHLKTLNSKF